MEFNLLKLEPDYSIVSHLLKVKPIALEDISTNSTTEEYDYQGFEYAYNALDTVCSHAVAMILKIQKEKSHSAYVSLSRDYRNAIKCLLLGKEGYRYRIDALTRYMLSTDWKTVVEAITDMNIENTKKTQDDMLGTEYIPDYGKLLVRAGDNALFIEDDFDKAMREYSTAILIWRSKYKRNVYSLSDNEYSLSVGEKEKIRSYIELYYAIKNGLYINNDKSYLNSSEKEIVSRYKSILEKSNLHNDIIDDIEDLAKIISTELQNIRSSIINLKNHPMFESDALNTLRTINILWSRLIQLGYLDEIRLLSDTEKNVQSELKTIAIQKAKYLIHSELDWIWDALLNTKSKEWAMLTAVAKVEEDIRQIKKMLLLDGDIPELAYYTTWNTLSYMLPDDKKESDNSNVGKFSVMHLCYMNDPMEGIVINKFLFGNTEQIGRKQDTQPYTFVKCFSPSVDYLPMWKMYGDDAAGCCIVVDWKKTIKQNPGKKIALYRVCYLSLKNGSYVFVKKENNEAISTMDTLLNKLKMDIGALRSVEDNYHLSEALLSSIAYLFKDSSYSYEKEARILYSYNKYNSQIQMTNQDPPKLFVYPDYRVIFRELILGPKFKDVDLWLPYIKMKLEKMNKIVMESNNVKLTLSEIKYR